MIQPVHCGNDLLENIRGPLEEGSLRLWWLGQSGYLVRYRIDETDLYVLIDPYLSDSLTRKYADTDKPHVRMTEIPIEASQLDMVDIVTSSHNHTDHLDGETLQALLVANPHIEFIVPAANVEFASKRLGVSPSRLTEINDGQSKSIRGVTINAVPAAHETVERDSQGQCRFLGYVLQFGPHTIYHSGDTLRYDEQVTILGKWSVDLAILPINGSAPERRVAGNLNGEQAATLAKDMNASCVIPCHYEMFEFNTATTDTFQETCERLGQTYQVLTCGGSLTLSEGLHADG